MKMKIFWIILVLVSAQLTSCKSSDKVTEPEEKKVTTDTIPVPSGYTLVWHDEFSDSTLDKTKWNYEINGGGGGNNELQYYTDSPKNCYVKSGNLVICALKENYLGKEYTSARLNSNAKGDWKYGRFEVRAKLPYGQGMWPAIWLLPTDWVYGGWPASGEIDIMELLGQEKNRIYGTMHFGSSFENHLSKGGSYKLTSGDFSSTYHKFQLEWDSVYVKWYVDDVLYYTASTIKPFDQRFHFILNVAVGGNWPGPPDATTMFPQRMAVDYVRVYAKK
jgi:beta-glucanase (GH16 family)